jgi:trk system potassium uptake protein TrkH
MLLFGVNFTCYYYLLLKQVKSVFEDQELRLYLAIVFGSIVLIVINLWGYYDTIGETIRHAAFQVASIISTTGFATTDFDLWPSFSKSILLILMVLGACAGSTGGGLKMGRALLIIKNLRRNIRRLLNPKRVEVVRLNGARISEDVLTNTNTYLAAYVVIIIVSFLLVSVDGLSITTNISDRALSRSDRPAIMRTIRFFQSWYLSLTCLPEGLNFSRFLCLCQGAPGLKNKEVKNGTLGYLR